MTNFPFAADTQDDLFRAADRGSSVLSGAIDASTLSVTVLDGSYFPAGRHTVTIESEILIVASRAANVLTIEERGAFGTVAAIHADQEKVSHNFVAGMWEGVTDAIAQMQAELIGFRLAVLAYTDTPPGAPNTGDRYLVATGATGAWNTQDGNFAHYDGSTWVFTTPSEGWIVLSKAEKTLYYLTSDGWENFRSPYQMWLDLGNVGTEQDFLDSLVGADGAPGADGVDGLSAYEVWINQGNVGTEQDFLDSLVGADGAAGATGADGLSAYEVWLAAGNVGTEQDYLDSLVGPTGPAGADAQLPIGGTTGQVLAKASNTDGDVNWVDQSGGTGLPAGGTAGQHLVKQSLTDGDAAWESTGEVPTGGAAGQVLAKATAFDYATEWIDLAAGAAALSSLGWSQTIGDQAIVSIPGLGVDRIEDKDMVQQDNICYYPFIVNQSTKIYGASIEFTNANVGAKLAAAIYASSSSKFSPGTIVTEFTVADVALGLVDIAIPSVTTLNPGVYWLAVWCDGNAINATPQGTNHILGSSPLVRPIIETPSGFERLVALYETATPTQAITDSWPSIAPDVANLSLESIAPSASDSLAEFPMALRFNLDGASDYFPTTGTTAIADADIDLLVDFGSLPLTDQMGNHSLSTTSTTLEASPNGQGLAVGYNGTTYGYVRFGNTKSEFNFMHNDTTPYTIDFILKNDDNADRGLLASYTTSPTVGISWMAFNSVAGNEYYYTIGKGTSGQQAIFLGTGANYWTNQWVHVSIVYHSYTKVQIYLDGILIIEGSCVGAATAADATFYLESGRYANSGSGESKAVLDQIRITKQALYDGDFTPYSNLLDKTIYS